MVLELFTDGEKSLLFLNFTGNMKLSILRTKNSIKLFYTLSKRIAILFLSLLMLSTNSTAQEKDEQIAEQKKLEGQIKESKKVTETIER